MKNAREINLVDFFFLYVQGEKHWLRETIYYANKEPQ